MSPRAVFAILVAAVAGIGPVSAQEAELAALSMDALIDRLPEVGAEWSQGEMWTLHPASAELRRRLEDGARLDDEQWRRALLDTGVLRVRATWPVDEPFTLSLRKAAWLGDFALVLRPERDGLAPAQLGTFFRGFCGNPAMAAAARSLHQALGRLPLGRHALYFRLELLRRPPGPARDTWGIGLVDEYLASVSGQPAASDHRRSAVLPTVAASAELLLFVDVVPSLDAVLPPVSSPELDRAVGESLHLCFFHPQGWAFLNGSRSSEGPLQGLACSLRIELFEGAELRQTVTYQPTAGESPMGHPFDGVGLTSLPKDLRTGEGWWLRVRGTDEKVLRSWGCDRRWAGTIELTLAELIERGARLECGR